jgi:hypothetical protein
MFPIVSSSCQPWWDITFTCSCNTDLYPHWFVLSFYLSQNRSPDSRCNLSELLTSCSRDMWLTWQPWPRIQDPLDLVWIFLDIFPSFKCKTLWLWVIPALCQHAVMYRKPGVLDMQIRLTASINMSKSAGIFTKIDPQLISDLQDCIVILYAAILQIPLTCLPWESHLSCDIIFVLFFTTHTPAVQCLKSFEIPPHFIILFITVIYSSVITIVVPQHPLIQCPRFTAAWKKLEN